jgi:choline dehydrogenase-like flavoprotein
MSDYDVIVVGSGAGGGTLVRRLASTGKRILLLERGDWLAREPENWDARSVFVENRYVSEDTWYDEKGEPFQPQIHYCVGGATKLYGAALYRLPAEDFGELAHQDGMSPAWPISYDEMEPYYTLAEQLYHELKSMLAHLGMHPDHLLPRHAYLKNEIPVAGVAHQAGTCRFGADPATSVLNGDCRAHEVDNLYVVDTSFFPSIGAVNPALTAMANALRVGDHIADRIGAEVGQWEPAHA